LYESFFDSKFYLDTYPDLKMNGVNTEKEAIIHWNLIGQNELRHLSLSDSLFNWQYYLDKYPDLRINGIHTEKQAITHWRKYGKNEGRQPYDNTIKDDIEDKLVFFDDNKLTYNIGDLLNVPHLFSDWQSNPHASKEMYNLFYNTADAYPNSILHIYKTTRINDKNENENMPNPERLTRSIDIYGINKNIIVNIDENTLYVHIRTGDKNVIEDIFIDIIYKLYQEKYNNIIILTGIHNDVRFGDKQSNINNLTASLIKLERKGIKYSVNLDTPDNHFYIMRNCKNLLVHKGGFSIIGALIFNGNKLYITPRLFEPFMANNSKFFHYVKKYELV
jgi:hypothetical protein